jgi:hypothetical protein
MVLADCRMLFHRGVMQMTANRRRETMVGEGSSNRADGDTIPFM